MSNDHSTGNGLVGIASALAKIPSGAAIITASDGSQSTGMLASWIQQASFEPPMITVCVRRGRPIKELLDRSLKFTVNILGDDAVRWFKHFARGFTLGEDAFAGLEPRPSAWGPVLPGSVAHLHCRVVQRWEAGDHDIYLGQVDCGHSGTEPPYVHLRKSGLTY